MGWGKGEGCGLSSGRSTVEESLKPAESPDPNRGDSLRGHSTEGSSGQIPFCEDRSSLQYELRHGMGSGAFNSGGFQKITRNPQNKLDRISKSSLGC